MRVNKEKRKQRLGEIYSAVILRLAAVMLCLLLVTMHMMGGLYARYTTEASASDSARVAKFDVQVSAAVTDVKLVSGGESKTQTITITDNSEVKTQYIFTITQQATDSKGLPLSFAMTKGSSSLTQTKPKANVWQFTDIRNVGDNAQQTYTLTITGNGMFGAGDGLIDTIKLDITAEQVK